MYNKFFGPDAETSHQSSSERGNRLDDDDDDDDEGGVCVVKEVALIMWLDGPAALTSIQKQVWNDRRGSRSGVW